ncbi:MAG TPA: ABC transporter ATP-binding protein [Niabella sp.]|nr:ABC transporter ATP-binding protein [Niabella sp.]HOZ95450.1 ABC transporter ATP-binding protein [Niabella sp.]HQW14340.1 ABC transporter ATP-binding protein [Niabella sp.]HQX18381.1 ABC transporter ATP-binding protein [Niabella sp.]HQX40127.1 ABC transporter ATP-binding protein [Niabella sp.]
MKKFRRIFNYIGLYKGKVALYIFLTIVGSALSVVSIAMLGPLMSIIFNVGGDTAQSLLQKVPGGHLLAQELTEYVNSGERMNAVLLCCVFIITSIFLKNLFLYSSSRVSVPVRSSIVIHLKNDMYSKILKLPVGYFSEQKKGDIMSRMTNDIGQVESSIVNTLEGMIKDPILVISYLAAMIAISPSLSVFLFILLPVTAFIIGRISRTLKKQSNEAAVRVGDTLSILDETLGGIRIIKAFVAEKILKNRFVSLNNTLFGIIKKMAARRDLASPLTELLGVVVLCVIIYFGANLIDKGSLNPGDLIAFIAMFAMMINPAKALSSSFFNVQTGSAAIERIEELLNAPVKVEDMGTKKLEAFESGIEFKNVSFSYNEKLVLRNINLVIPKGKTVALVGSSGAGKSTLADLIPRFHDTTQGEILVDGINIKNYSIQSVREKIGIVSQEPILFNETIGNNIALADPDASMEAIAQAAKIANAHQFIDSKPEKYDTNIGDRGAKLSGGEKQRLTIARAVLKNPPILILDEATSSLDTESERLVQDAINNMMQNRTSIVIAHRLSTVRNADEIVVLNKGEIAERGKHDELMQITGGIYKKLVDMQGLE